MEGTGNLGAVAVVDDVFVGQGEAEGRMRGVGVPVNNLESGDKRQTLVVDQDEITSGGLFGGVCDACVFMVGPSPP